MNSKFKYLPNILSKKLLTNKLLTYKTTTYKNIIKILKKCPQNSQANHSMKK
jgi:hypothetical protein